MIFFLLWSHVGKFKTAPMQAMSKLLQAHEPYQTDLKDYCAAALKKQEWGETEVNCHALSSLADLPTLPQLVPAHSKALRCLFSSKRVKEMVLECKKTS